MVGEDVGMFPLARDSLRAEGDDGSGVTSGSLLSPEPWLEAGEAKPRAAGGEGEAPGAACAPAVAAGVDTAREGDITWWRGEGAKKGKADGTAWLLPVGDLRALRRAGWMESAAAVAAAPSGEAGVL